MNLNSQNVKEQLLKFGHFVALGVSLVIIGMGFWSDRKLKPRANADLIDDKIVELENKIRNSKPPEKELEDYFPKVKQNWSAEFSVVNGPTSDSIYLSSGYEFKHEIPPNEQWINTPQRLSITTDRSKIRITWDHPEPLFDKQGKQRDMTTVSGYHLSKVWTEKNDKKEKNISLSAETLEYDDADVETNVTYSYRVRCYTDNTAAKGGAPKTPIKFNGEEIIASEYTKEQSGTILPSYKIRLNGIIDHPTNAAMIAIAKWERNDWREALFTVKVGQKIEGQRKVQGYPDLVSFTPNWTLKRVIPKDIQTITKTVKEILKDKDGKPVLGPDGRLQYIEVEKKTSLTVAAIEYEDEKGNAVKVVYSQERESTPQKQK